MNVIRKNNSLPKSQNLSYLNGLKEQINNIIDYYKNFDEINQHRLKDELIVAINNYDDIQINTNIEPRITIEDRVSELQSTVFELLERVIDLEHR